MNNKEKFTPDSKYHVSYRHSQLTNVNASNRCNLCNKFITNNAGKALWINRRWHCEHCKNLLRKEI